MPPWEGIQGTKKVMDRGERPWEPGSLGVAGGGGPSWREGSSRRLALRCFADEMERRCPIG